MLSLKAIILLELYALVYGDFTYSYTDTDYGKLCRTPCVFYHGYHYCYLSWGTLDWDYCIPGTTKIESHKTILGSDCYSLCGKFAQTYYNWCQPNEGRNWEYCGKHPISIALFTDNDRDITPMCGTFENGKFVPFFPATAKQSLPFSSVENLAYNYEREYGTHRFEPAEGDGRSYSLRQYTAINAPPADDLEDLPLPVVLRAVIPAWILRQERLPIPDYISRRMVEMNRLDNDERGHLLADSLGGPIIDINFVPQTPMLNRNAGGQSYWYNVELAIRNFLLNHPNGHVNWTLVIIYGQLNSSRRPTRFALRVVYFSDATTFYGDTGDMYFSNDPSPTLFHFLAKIISGSA